jgi:hypothetical protein
VSVLVGIDFWLINLDRSPERLRAVMQTKGTHEQDAQSMKGIVVTIEAGDQDSYASRAWSRQDGHLRDLVAAEDSPADNSAYFAASKRQTTNPAIGN